MMRRLATVLAAAASCASALAAAPDVEALLSSMRAAYKGVLTARLKTEVVARGVGNEFAIRIDYMRANRVFGVLVPPKSKLNGPSVATNGVNIRADGFRAASISQPFTIDDLNRFLPGNLETLCFWDSERQLSTGQNGNMHTSKLRIVSGSWNNRKWAVLEETSSQSNVFARYFIDPKTHFIWRTIVRNLKTHALIGDYKLVSLQVGVKMDLSQFDPKER